MGRIVVGVDGSEGAGAALRWAVHEAELRGSELELVHGWMLPYIESGFTGLAVGACEEAGAAILGGAQDVVRELAPGVTVRTSSLAAPPSGALVERSEGAELVVVGSRGRGGFAGLLLGSVSTQVVHHARCPVVVVRH